MFALRKASAFLRRDLIEESSYKLAFLLRVGGIFFQSFAFFFLSKLVGKGTVASLEPYGGDYFSFVLVGIAFSSYHQAALSGFSRTIREAQMKGTLEAVLLTQTGVPTIILCSSFYRFIWSFLGVVLYLLVGIVVLGVKVGGANLLGVLVVLLLTIASFSGIGIISASFVMVFKKGDPLAFAFSGASFLLGGVFYPVAVLPSWLQKISYVLPIRHSLEGMRLCLLKQASFKIIAPSVIALLGFTAVLLPLGLFCFRRAVRRAKMDGSLTHY
jgi:ABC-2 type transport system permease protein